MNIRRANEKDIPRLIELLEQVLQIHADIRPDIFIPGTTKYTEDELKEMLKDDTKPVYVAADENDVCLGYAFCQLKQQPFSNNMVPFTSLFIDDLCVDAKTRGQHVGESLFEYVKGEAKRLGCYEVTLNVWAGNTSAEKFYEKMGLKTKERHGIYIVENEKWEIHMCLQEIKDEIIDAGKESVLENMVSLYLHELSEKEEILDGYEVYTQLFCV